MKRLLPCLAVALALVAITGASWYLSAHVPVVLNPAGIIARAERNLMITATLLMLTVVIPVFVLTIFITLRYRESNQAAKYTPDWDHDPRLELIWWAIPCVIITILGVIAWQSSHALDPFRPIASSVPPLNVQVIALDWKWLFIYPQQNLATVNQLVLPTNRPINLQITSDAPMNSLWIPQLGGQIYAMPGMSTQLHLEADRPGTYYGSSANISGSGFASMNFATHALSQRQFNNWVSQARQAKSTLDASQYATLAQPSQGLPPQIYAPVEGDLYDEVVMKYMMPMTGMNMSSGEMP